MKTTKITLEVEVESLEWELKVGDHISLNELTANAWVPDIDAVVTSLSMDEKKPARKARKARKT